MSVPRRPDPEPLEVDDVKVAIVGTIAWAVALVALLPFTDSLRRHGHLWFVAAAASGVVLGLVGIAFLRRRRDRGRRRSAGEVVLESEPARDLG